LKSLSITKIALFSLLTILASCSSFGIGDRPAGTPFEAKALNAPLENDRARVFFYRQHAFVNSSVWAEIKDGERHLGKSYDSSVMSETISAGAHELYISSPSPLALGHVHLSINVEGGNTYYVEISPTSVAIPAGNTLVTVQGGGSSVPKGNVRDCGGGFCGVVLSAEQAIPRLGGLVDLGSGQ